VRESKVSPTSALKFAAFTGVAFLVCQAVFHFSPGVPFETAFVAPIGVAVALLLLAGASAAVPIFFGTFAAYAFAMRSPTGLPAGSALFGAGVISAIIAVQSVASCWAAQKYCKGREAFERPRTIFYFLAVAGIGIAGVAAVARALCASFIQSSVPVHLWLLVWTWWLGSLCGLSAVTPAVLAWRNTKFPSLSVSRLGEYGILILLLIFCCNIVFGGVFPQQVSASLAFIMIPLLVWSARRFGRRGASLAVLLLVFIALDATVHNSGPLASSDRNTSLALLQTFVVIVSSLAFVVQADVFERRSAVAALQTSESGFRRLFEHSETFATLGKKLSAARTPREAAAIMFEAADALFKWDASIFELLVPDKDTVVNILCIDIVDGVRKEVAPDPGVRTVSAAGMAAMQGPKLILREPDSRFTPAMVPFGDKTRPSASLMFVPVKNGSRVIGSLSLQSYAAKAFNERDLQTLESLADHCAGALDRIRAESESERLAGELKASIEILRSFNESLEARVQERTSQLQMTNKELEAFSYSVSHDLRAPLRSIRGFTEVLLERHSHQLDERGLEFLRRVCASSQQMDKLIEDLLKLSRVGRAEMQWQEVDLSTISESILTELQKGDARREVDFSVAPGLRARGDERLLRVVMDNLLQNAWKFTGKTAKAKIEVAQNADGSVFVKDNGAGFDEKYGSRLFGVFQRLHTASEFPGTGVGLATAQRVINRHGGKIWAEGTINHGATFYFTLPQHEPC
jgi:signal transduction histidine kinase/integral membrane sensor domain MASE1